LSPNPNRRALADRFWAKVSGGDVTTCWTWTGATQTGGYGSFGVGGGKQVLAHRFSYEFMRTEIPSGLQIDHLCRVRTCVNPWHMEPVTGRVNILRSTNFAAVNASLEACRRGHLFTEENTRIQRQGNRRHCRACARERNRLWRAQQKAKAVAS
jgi:hypothetical protein